MNYQIKKNHQSRSIKIKIDSDGKVIVTSPDWISDKKVVDFVTSKKNWIEESLKKIENQKKIIDPKKELMIFGKKYQLKIIYDPNLPLGISLTDSDIIINQLEKTSSIATQNKIKRFIKNTAEKYIIPRTHQIAKHMKIEFKNITLREQATRWGSCSNQGNLNFNWRLVHHPTKVIDYVIVHELAHRVHLDHSASFWKLVEKYDSEYRIHQGWLKRKGKVW